MPHTCEFCHASFSRKNSLIRHQKTTRFCIELQAKKGIVIEPEKFDCCDCGASFTHNSSLKRHQNNSCTKINVQTSNIFQDKSTMNVTNNNTTITNNNTININISKPLTMGDLTKDYIIARLTPVLTKEIIKAGISAITELVVDVLLQKDGKYCYYCSDKSRKKFIMLIDHEGNTIEQRDANAQCLRNILTVPLSTIVGSVAAKDFNKKIAETYESVKDLSKDGADLINTLASTLPNDSDGIPECMRSRIEEAKNDTEGLAEIARLDKIIAINKRKKEARDICPYVE